MYFSQLYWMTVATATYPNYIHWVFSVGDPGSCKLSLDPLHSDKNDENDQVN